MNAQFLVKPHTFSCLGSIRRWRLALENDFTYTHILATILSAIHPVSKSKIMERGFWRLMLKFVV